MTKTNCDVCGHDRVHNGCGRDDCPHAAAVVVEADLSDVEWHDLELPGVSTPPPRGADLSDLVSTVGKIRGLADNLQKAQERMGRLLTDSGEAFLNELAKLAAEDVEGLGRAYEHYGPSWKQRGGVGAFMMTARKWDRLERQLARRLEDPFTGVVAHQYDVFSHLAIDHRPEGVIDDIRDLRRYLLLIEAEMRARGFDATHRDNA